MPLKQRIRRSAVIDIGSNSVRLVVYEGPPRAPAIIFNEKVAAGLGRGLAVDGCIAPEDAKRGLAALRRYMLLARQMCAKDLQCIATAAVRDASNGAEFIASAQAAGLPLRLLTGAEEAEASAYGVIAAIPDADGIVVDLGGGSLELAEVKNGKVGRKASFPLGVLRLRPLREKGQQPFERAVRRMMRAADWPGDLVGSPLYLVGGSWRALSRLDMAVTQNPLAILDQHHLPRTAMRRVVRASKRMSAERLKAIPGMPGSRAETVPDAAALLAALVNIIEAPEMTVSSSGLREGLLYQALDARTRAQDPLIQAAQFEGRRLSRFGVRGRVLADWIAPLFEEDSTADARLRLAACLLSDVAWSANPDFRAERGAEIGLYGNWRGIDNRGRVLLGRALHSGFGGGDQDFPDMGDLATSAELEQARRWGLAIRLGQRLSGGLDATLGGTRLCLTDQELQLRLAEPWHDLAGEAVERRLKALAQAFGRKPKVLKTD
ncbi:MAG TPA: Ppx/GppA family phosphatase [Sphingopyxis sp.]|nr:Ppx/GppA family phosphatase [Sphingopyxis sp.]